MKGLFAGEGVAIVGEFGTGRGIILGIMYFTDFIYPKI